MFLEDLACMEDPCKYHYDLKIDVVSNQLFLYAQRKKKKRKNVEEEEQRAREKWIISFDDLALF